MGLDIYLHPIEEHKADQAYDDAWENLWQSKEAGEITEEQFNVQVDALVRPLRVDDVSSRRYPGHLFKRTYLRSSYNGGGFNRAVPEFLGDPEHGSLYWVFGPMGREWDGDEGVLTEEDIPKLAGDLAVDHVGHKIHAAGEMYPIRKLIFEAKYRPAGSPTNSDNGEPSEWTPEQVVAQYKAQYPHLTAKRIRQLVREGVIPHIRRGRGSIWLDQASVDALLAHGRQGGQ